MRTTLSTGLLSAALAAAILAPGCRTINRSRDRVTADDIPFETVDQPSRIARTTAPVAEAPVVEVPVAVPPVVEEPDVDTPVVDVPAPKPVVKPADKAVLAPPAVLEPVTAKRPEMDTTPYEAKVVKSADQVGKPGSYVERVIPEDGGDKPVPVELDGLSGQTGRHISAPAPAPEPVPVVKPAPADSGWYVVQPGDILGRIAQKHGVSRQAILDANPSIKDPNKLKIGQKIKIPPRGTGITDKPKTAKKAATATKAKKKTLPAKDGYIVYTVKKGDILGRIAKANKTTQKAILEANNLADANRIIEGQPLYIPAPGAKAAGSAEAAPKAAVKKAANSDKTLTVIDEPASGEGADDILKGFNTND